jgi:hypothetical protein
MSKRKREMKWAGSSGKCSLDILARFVFLLSLAVCFFACGEQSRTFIEGDAVLLEAHDESFEMDIPEEAAEEAAEETTIVDGTSEDVTDDEADWPDMPSTLGYIRAMAETSPGRYLVAADNAMFLVDDGENVVWSTMYSPAPRLIKGMPDGGAVFWGGGIGRIDASGNILWYTELQDTSMDPLNAYMEVNDLLVTSDGGIVAVGGRGWYYRNFGTSIYNIVVFKFNARGDLLWQKNYMSDATASGVRIVETSDGGFLIAANDVLNPGSDYGPRPQPSELVSIHSNGEIRWWWRFGWTLGIIDAGVAPGDGYIFALGDSSPWFYSPTAWLLRVELPGEIVWQVGVGVMPDDRVSWISFPVTEDGGVVLAGYDDSAAYAVAARVNRDGVGWLRSYSLGDRTLGPSEIVELDGGGFLMAGNMEADEVEAFLMEIDGNGLVSDICPPGMGTELPYSFLETGDIPKVDVAGEVSDSAYVLVDAAVTVTPVDLAPEILCSD